MKRLQLLYIALAGALLLISEAASAQRNVLQLFANKQYTPLEWSEIDHIGFDTERDLINIAPSEGEEIYFNISSKPSFVSGHTLPLIEIFTDEYVTEIPSKEEYNHGTFSLRGFGNFDDIKATEFNIRGRGNSSWNLAKKPYRLKFDKKISLCGLKKAKNYVLLSNYGWDPTQMQYAIACWMAQKIGLPYTPEVVPVEVKLNGIYKGSYVLTNKPGINAGSVDIDEDNSIMWELDTYFDEEYEFKSPLYNLPTMAVDPDMTQELFDYWKNDFIEAEEGVKNGKADLYFDLDVYGRYLLVYDICKNDELQHPKSVKLFKTAGEDAKYIFGPIWDFDGAWSFWTNIDWYTQENVTKRVKRIPFLSDLENYPETRNAYREGFRKIRDCEDELWLFIEEYYADIRNAAKRNDATWVEFMEFDKAFAAMKEWLRLRFEAMEEFDYIKNPTQDYSNSPAE